MNSITRKYAVVFAEGKEAGKVRMIESGHRDRFLKEALFDDLITTVFLMKLLDRDDTPRGINVSALKTEPNPPLPI